LIVKLLQDVSLYIKTIQQSDNPAIVFAMKKLQILGSGCPKCKKLAEQTDAAAQALGIEYELEKVTDINDILSFGVMMTPALVVDGDVKIMGKVPNVDELKTLIA
jgi:small redox-active disulfide protein 2